MGPRFDKRHRMQPRFCSIDALRGLAVLLMIAQHVAFWVTAEMRGNWVVQVTGALGGLAAPLFVTLSGVGVILLAQRHANSDRLSIIRGGIVIGLGYLMNALTPHWFSMGSWYVLHMIGAALIVAPLLRRASDPLLLLLVVATLALTAALQTYLDTPLRLFNNTMAVPIKPGGVVRHALVEGFFPIFPWIAFFMAGLLAGRWLLGGRPGKIVRLAALLLGVMALLVALNALDIGFARHDGWVRVFKLQPTFYPALTPISLLLISLSLFFIALFWSYEKKFSMNPAGFMICLGRASLTFLIVHVVVIRESAHVLGFWKSMPAMTTVVTTATVLIFFSLVAVLWRQIHFRFGAEWLLRRAAG